MAVRQEKVQLDIEFITDESKAFARTLISTKEMNAEIEKSRAKIKAYQQQLVEAGNDEKKRTEILAKIAVEEKKVADGMGKIVAEGKKVAGLDLSKLTPAQLVERAKQLEMTLRHMSQTAPGFKELQAELAGVNGILKEIRDTSRGISPGGQGGGMLDGILGRVGAIGARLAPILAGVTAAIQTLRGAANFEQLQISFETFLGSAERAKAVIAELTDFEARTPFESEQVFAAGRALLAYGESAENLIPTLTMLGDISAATGKDFTELAVIYGKARAEGVIQNDTLNQIAEAGIPIYDELAKVLGVGTSQIRKMAEQGKISFPDLQKALANLTGEGSRFGGLMEKQSQSLSGLWSSLVSQVKGLGVDIGNMLLPFAKGVLEYAIPAVQFFRAHLAGLGGFFKQTWENIVLNVQTTALEIVKAGQKVKNWLGADNAADIAATQEKLNGLYAQMGTSAFEAYYNAFTDSMSKKSLAGETKGLVFADPTKPTEGKKKKAKPDFSVDSDTLSADQLLAQAEKQLEKDTEAEKLRIYTDAQAEAEFAQREHNERMLSEEEARAARLIELETAQTEAIRAEAEKQREIEQIKLGHAQEAFRLGQDLIGLDEKARRKHANLVKTFQIGEIVTSGINEVQKIYAKYAAIPGGQALALPEAIFAGIRTGIAVAKVVKQKFARGGFTGGGYGAPDSTGYRPAGIVHEGEYVVPKWQVSDPTNAPLLRYLESRRMRGYAEGGFVSVNTTPSGNFSVPQPVPPAANMAAFDAIVVRFEAAVAAMPRHVTASVVYTDIEEVGATLNSIRDEAAI